MNPIFQRTFEAPYIPFHRHGYVVWLILSPFLVCGSSAFFFRQEGSWFVTAAILQLYFLYVSIHSLSWAISVGSSIAKEQETKTHDLLCLTPSGAVGRYWAIYTACVYRKREFFNFNNESTWVIRFLFAIPTVFATTIIAGVRFVTNDPVIILIYFIALIMAFYVDHVQSVLVGSLTGMLVPTYTRNRIDSRLFVTAAFLTLQILSYFQTWLIGFVFFSALYDAIPAKSTYLEIILPLLRLAAFYAIREGVIRLLWEALCRQLNASDVELALMTASKVKKVGYNEKSKTERSSS
jgi:hypothetical protein